MRPSTQMRESPSSWILSPGRPISRFTYAPPSPQARAAASGAAKTTIWPRLGDPTV